VAHELVHVLAGERENLNAPVLAVGDVDEAVVGDANRVHDTELVGARAFRDALQARRRTLVAVDRLIAERAPHAFERTRVGVEYRDAMVAVSIGYEELVGLPVNPDVRRLVQVTRVGVAFALRGAADLQQEPAVGRELEQLIVADRLQAGQPARRAVVSADPDAAAVIDVNAVLAFGPFEALAGSAPRAQEISARIENQYGGSGGLTWFQRAWSMQNVNVVLRVDADAGGVAEPPLLGHLRPARLDFEYWNA
jgi:hypothetical protein